ncbi:MAG: ATP-binding cassette domain-containing protein [Fusobacteria bacterium]|nr:ATP-binding cassette domain-containing protein [Fusobacteriota bacterium]
MINREYLEKNNLDKFITKYPFVEEFIKENKLNIVNRGLTLFESIDKYSDEELEDIGINKDEFIEKVINYTNQMIEFLDIKDEEKIESITILPGNDKNKNRENFESLNIKAGEIVCIVGPTGSGKSRLLADIEWTAQNDTPTNRKILVNGIEPDKKWRYSSSNKLVAQLSQNMNFVMDLNVYDFLELHAKSRLVENPEEIIRKIIDKANELAGEKFTPDTPITSLSGGQSRALMIADTAILSKSPVVLIDEIENAGIDRKKALNLLVGEEKIVLMATHDPLLALVGNKRIVINNGGITKVINTTEKEKEFLVEIEAMDKIVQELRRKLRYGEIIEKI